jgi:hypothetical protein
MIRASQEEFCLLRVVHLKLTDALVEYEASILRVEE